MLGLRPTGAPRSRKANPFEPHIHLRGAVGRPDLGYSTTCDPSAGRKAAHNKLPGVWQPLYSLLDQRSKGRCAGMNANTITSIPRPRTVPDRFLIGIVAGVVALLALVGISLVMLRQPAPQLPIDSPSGVVQRFYTAVQQRDFDEAYQYLSANMGSYPTRDEFSKYNLDRTGYSYYGSSDNERVRIGEETIHDNRAIVTVLITTFYAGNPLFGGSSEYTNTESFSLQREADGWRITELPYQFRPW